MRCWKCGSDNREGANFCNACGAALGNKCAACGALNQPDAKFCDECGAALSSSATTKAERRAAVVVPSAGERRHLTVLFCDLVGSTEIAARLDPEEGREVIAGYHRAAAEAVTHYGGHVAQYLGDGVMAFFGYPEAHDNDAERAARAGLAMLDAIAKLGEEAWRPKLAARVGIDSGAVVVGAGAGKEADVFGEAPNIAARVQAAAEPGTVLITDTVHRLISGLFVVESRGASVLKGIERPLQLYRVVRPSGMRGRLEAATAVHGLTPFVGRENELLLLKSRWERAFEGEGQVVLVIGEAGIGKSRLLQRFHEEVPAPGNWLEAAAAPFFQHTPFHAIAELLRQLVGQASLSATDVQAARANANDGEAQSDTDERLAQLESALLMAGLKPAEAIPLIAPLLNLPAAAKYPPPPIPPEQQRRRLLVMLVEWVMGVARAQPLTIVLEDLHWADASTLEVIQLLAEQGPTAPLLLLCTARPEFHPQWPLRTHHAQITLNRLSARNVREMIAQVAARHVHAGETVETVIERTGGVPLFVEELTRAVLESGSANLARREIPVTLHDLLMARLDRLGPAKDVIQIGAVIGSEFSYELLHEVYPVGAEELQTALRSATDAELVYVRGIAPEATYQFKHALIRDAAYEALLKSRRKDLHRLIAQTISEKFQALKAAQPELLARHWAEAGETDRAIAEWSRAGKAAEANNAFKEAQESYQWAMALLTQLPESIERDLRELELRQAVVRILFILRGYSDSQTIEATPCAVSLAEKSGNLRHLLNLIIAQGLSALVSGDLTGGSALADRALELAAHEDSASILGRLHLLQMMAHYYRGHLAGAEKHFTQGLEFFEHPSLRSVRGAAAGAFSYGSYIAWMAGHPDIARQRMSQMLASANGSDPYELAFSRSSAADLLVSMRQYEQAESSALRALEVAEKHNFREIIANCHFSIGWAHAQLNRPNDGITLIRQGLTEMLDTKQGHDVRATGMAVLAEAQYRAGSLVEALETIQQALHTSPDVPILRPEILRISGELQLANGQTELAETDFRQALALVRSMGAKSWELRATMDLARLVDSEGRRGEARTMLAEIYGWFSEGFDTADLKEAKALLEELAL